MRNCFLSFILLILSILFRLTGVGPRSSVAPFTFWVKETMWSGYSLSLILSGSLLLLELLFLGSWNLNLDSCDSWLLTQAVLLSMTPRNIHRPRDNWHKCANWYRRTLPCHSLKRWPHPPIKNGCPHRCVTRMIRVSWFSGEERPSLFPNFEVEG